MASQSYVCRPSLAISGVPWHTTTIRAHQHRVDSCYVLPSLAAPAPPPPAVGAGSPASGVATAVPRAAGLAPLAAPAPDTGVPSPVAFDALARFPDERRVVRSWLSRRGLSEAASSAVCETGAPIAHKLASAHACRPHTLQRTHRFLARAVTCSWAIDDTRTLRRDWTLV